MTGYSLIHEARAPRETPRAAWLICCALLVVIVLPDPGWRHGTVEWLKHAADNFDTALAPLPPAPSQAAVPIVARPPPPPSREAPRLAVPVDSNNRCLVQLSLNGHGPFRFIVDTGADEVVLTKSQAARLGFDLNHMKTDHTSQGWGGGRVRAAFVELHEVRLGDFALHGFQVSLEMESGDEGLLGITFLRRLGRFEVADGQCRFYW